MLAQRGVRLDELAVLFGAVTIGNSAYLVMRPGEAIGGKSGDIVFVESLGQLEACVKSGAAALASPQLFQQGKSIWALNGLACAEPRLHFHVAYRILAAHDDLAGTESVGVCISADAAVHASAMLAPGCVVQAGARIEAHAALYPGVVVEQGATVGAGSIVRSRAVIGRDSVIGAMCDIGSGSVIGAEPQQFEAANGVWTRKPGKTRVRLGERVAVGANSVIECGARRETVLESDVLIGGQVYIAHDCQIERGVLIIGQSGLASGVRIGHGAALMARVAVDVDIHIGADAMILATSGVTKDVAVGARVWGNPARSRTDALRRYHRQNATVSTGGAF